MWPSAVTNKDLTESLCRYNLSAVHLMEEGAGLAPTHERVAVVQRLGTALREYRKMIGMIEGADQRGSLRRGIKLQPDYARRRQDRLGIHFVVEYAQRIGTCDHRVVLKRESGSRSEAEIALLPPRRQITSPVWRSSL